MKKHLSKGQFWGLTIFFALLGLAILAFFVNTRIALGIIAVMIFLSVCYLTIIVHPLLKSSKAQPSPVKTDVLSQVLTLITVITACFAIAEPMHS